MATTYSNDDKDTASLKENASLEAAMGIDPILERKTMRKVDLRLLIILGLIYSIALIDRTNISIARVAGMGKDLQLTVGVRYTLISLVFFIPYIILELPSTLMLRTVGVGNQLAIISVSWGIVMLGMGFLQNWTQLLICRVLLGILEAGFFPACVFLIQTWYTRYEVQKRISLFYLTAMFMSGFSNIMGYGITKLDGKGGLAAWRWIFIIFGIITIVLGIIGYFLIVDFPDKATFLTEEQRALVLLRINIDRGDALPDGFTGRKIMSHLSDWKIWMYGFAFCFTTLPTYAFAYFLPVILSGGGFTTQLSLILSAPPYAFAAFYTLLVATLADKYRARALCVSGNAVVCMIGLLMIAYGRGIGVRYAGCFFAVAGSQANVPSIISYSANNVLTHSKRTVCTAVIIGMGGMGGIMASTIYRQVDYPLYLYGFYGTIGAQGAILVICMTLAFYMHRANKAGGVVEGREGFKYTL